MSEIEYPRWAHAVGHKSIVVENAEEEEAFIAATAPKEPPAVQPIPTAAPALPQRYDIVTFEGVRDGEIGGIKQVAEPDGKYVLWADVASLFGENLLTDVPTGTIQNGDVLTFETDQMGNPPGTKYVAHDPKRRGGWPKGKPRTTKEASVN